jgi:predicted nuclease of predicted toxin-antitoxin system
MKILIDMNLSPRWVDFFVRHDIEAKHWSEAGPANAPDAEIMEYAIVNEYVVFTHDLDFSTILALTHKKKPSVIQIRSAEMTPDITAAPVISALKKAATYIEEGALVTIDENKTRIRILPF